MLLNISGLCSIEYDFVFIVFLLGYLNKSQLLIKVLFIEYSEILFVVFAGIQIIESSLTVTAYPTDELIFAELELFTWLV